MNPIEIGKAIDNYGIAMVTAIILILVVWLVRYLVKRSNEDRLYYRGLITTDLVKLHESDEKKAILNIKSLDLQRGMMKDLQDHNGHSEKFSEKVIKTLSLQTDAITLVCDKLNGGSHTMVEAKKRLNKDRRKVDKKVEVERRA